MIRRSFAMFGFGLSAVSLVGCTVTGRSTDTPRTANEQLILDQSLEQSLAHARIPIPPDMTVAVETVGLSPDTVPDKGFVQAGIERWLGRQGLRIPHDKQETYLLRVMIHAFGTNTRGFFLGIPPVQGGLFPISLPELAIFKSENQSGFTRFSIDIYERSSGRFLMSTPTHEGYTYAKGSTALFFITFGSSNLNPPAP
jgi:hypothetical protein